MKFQEWKWGFKCETSSKHVPEYASGRGVILRIAPNKSINGVGFFPIFSDLESFIFNFRWTPPPNDNTFPLIYCPIPIHWYGLGIRILYSSCLGFDRCYRFSIFNSVVRINELKVKNIHFRYLYTIEHIQLFEHQIRQTLASSFLPCRLACFLSDPFQSSSL